MKISIRILLALFFISGSFSVLSHVGSNSGNKSFTESLRSADLVFEGTVTEVQHRMASMGNDENTTEIPYTFVTYNVHRFIKGQANSNQVILRFLGGTAGEGQPFVVIPGQPLFDVGDHDILLVQGNEHFPCPLVGCAQGRYRFIGGLVVNELGQVLELSDEGELKKGPAIESEEVNTHQLTKITKLERNEVTELGDTEPVPPEELPEPTEGLRPDPSAFRVHVEDEVRNSHTTNELSEVPTFQSADPDAEIIDLVMQNVATGAEAPPEEPLPIDELNEEELAELRLEEERELFPERFKEENKKKERIILETVIVDEQGKTHPMPSIEESLDIQPTSKNIREKPQSRLMVYIVIPLIAIMLLIFCMRRSNDQPPFDT